MAKQGKAAKRDTAGKGWFDLPAQARVGRVQPGRAGVGGLGLPALDASRVDEGAALGARSTHSG